ncbi:hypothetical protein SELMODRAFT_420453 [Selaginella moellendorffii]|uniref:Pentatricopeptide repeat-containing protein n=1 Tax=Selaginella moellendorffii TaxID=88036 RepID=D8SC15_SELML|nr:hypothetical protein SELMODRAFT_420453 [Selaginella moellendorffii]
MEAEVVVVNSLLGFYGRCGCVVESCEVFNSAAMASAGRNAVTWNAIIFSYYHQGDVASAFRLFERKLEDHWQYHEVKDVVSHQTAVPPSYHNSPQWPPPPAPVLSSMQAWQPMVYSVPY